MGHAMIELKAVTRTYTHGTKEIKALHDITLSVKAGEFLSVMGPSGSGKSTLLNLIGGLDQPSSGKIFIDNRPLHGISDDELTLIRRRKVGFIFQFFNLLPILTAVENVSLPLLLEGTSFAQIRPKAVALLEKMGLGERVEHRPEQLSGGEMQRVAIARALVTSPVVLLADEPTGNLDSQTGAEIMALFDRLHQQGNTIVLVTHEHDIAEYANRIIHFKDGKVAGDERKKN